MLVVLELQLIFPLGHLPQLHTPALLLFCHCSGRVFLGLFEQLLRGVQQVLEPLRLLVGRVGVSLGDLGALPQLAVLLPQFRDFPTLLLDRRYGRCVGSINIVVLSVAWLSCRGGSIDLRSILVRIAVK